MCWQEVDWVAIGSYITWGATILFYFAVKVYNNRKRIKRNLDKLRNGKLDMDDADAIMDLLLFVLECATNLGGAKNVRGILEEAVESNDE